MQDMINGLLIVLIPMVFRLFIKGQYNPILQK